MCEQSEVSPPTPRGTRARVVFLHPPPVVPVCVLVCLPRDVGLCVYCATHVHRWVSKWRKSRIRKISKTNQNAKNQNSPKISPKEKKLKKIRFENKTVRAEAR